MLAPLGRGSPNNEEDHLQIGTGTIFIVLCVGAPWISRRWGWLGGLAWAIAALVFIIAIAAILLLD